MSWMEQKSEASASLETLKGRPMRATTQSSASKATIGTKGIIGAALVALFLAFGYADSDETWRAPDGFIPPPLHPEGAKLIPKELAPGVFALINDKPPVDNSGFVVGERGVLVIDSLINKEMATQVQQAVRNVTDKPILYLVNTNYHGDHTFGNFAFSDTTTIIAHRKTAEQMKQFEHEKEFLLQTVNNDVSVFEGVELRLPDITFDDYMSVDLGGQIVEIYHFGSANTAGDTVVYVPAAKAAWTGNFIIGRGSIPPLFSGGATAYLESLTRLSQTLDIETIVPGHVALTDRETVGRYMVYLNELIGSVRAAVRAGKSLDATLESLALGDEYVPSADSPLAELAPFFRGLHRFNVQITYLEMRG